jgi:ABC-type molybdate transport system permease subunit
MQNSKVAHSARFGVAKPVTRAIYGVLALPLNLAEALLFRGVPNWQVPPLPWPVVDLGTGLMGHWCGGRRLGIFCGLSAFYLVRVVILFGFGQVPAMLATLGFAVPPMARPTIFGIRNVPPDILESGKMSGCTPRQLLWKVELPIAFPEILLGINQTIMMALAVVAITALISSRDLGQEVYKALPGADTGRELLAGLGIAFIGIITSRLIGGWAKKMKQQLGITV